MGELAYFLMGAGCILGIWILSQKHDNSMNNIEHKLDLIMEHLGMNDSLDTLDDEEFNCLIEEGSTIKAIKRYRVVTHKGLKEAKDYVDTLMASKSEIKDSE